MSRSAGWVCFTLCSKDPTLPNRHVAQVACPGPVVMPITTQNLRGLIVLDRSAYDLVYAPVARRQIEQAVTLVAEPLTRQQLAARSDLLSNVDVIFSGWGCPRMDAAFLEAAPRLKAVFYAAGAIGGWATPAVFERGIVISSAATANAVPVAEYTLSTILFSLKHGWRLLRETREQRTFVDRDGAPGNFRRTVGLVGVGVIARLLIKLLSHFDLDVLAYDPYLSEAEAAALGIRKASLEAVFKQSDVVSLHAPEIAETLGMVDGRLLRSMKLGSTLINTARGGLIVEKDLISVLRARPDLHAVLDVTEPEPPAADSPLYDLPNITLTPHIAGSAGAECQRMAQYMVEDLHRYLAGERLTWQVTPDMTAHSIHRPVSTAKPRPQAIGA